MKTDQQIIEDLKAELQIKKDRIQHLKTRLRQVKSKAVYLEDKMKHVDTELDKIHKQKLEVNYDFIKDLDWATAKIKAIGTKADLMKAISVRVKYALEKIDNEKK